MKRILLTLTLVMSIFSSLFAQSYEELWNQVKTAQSKDLPRSVIDYAQQIYDKASREKNYPQLMKSWVTLIETKSDLDPDNFKIADFPPVPCHGPVQSAIYNAIMGSAYLVMQDTYISENDQETQEDFAAKSQDCFAKAMSNKEALASESAEDYMPLITKGEDSRFFNHDLLSLITRFIIEHSNMSFGQRADLYADVADFYQQHQQQDAWALMSFYKLKMLSNHEDFNVRLYGESYRKELKALIEQSKELEIGADIAAEYLEQIYDDDKRIDFIQWAVKQYPDRKYAQPFLNIQQRILQPSLSIQVASGALANRANAISIRGKNVTSASFEVREYNDTDKNHRLKTDGKLLIRRDYSLCQDSLNVARRDKGYTTEDAVTDSITLGPGHYVYIANSADTQDVEDVTITSLRLILVELPDDQYFAQVLDNETGRPVAGAQLTIKGRGDNIRSTQKCNQQGECIFKKEENDSYIFASFKGTQDQTQELSFSSPWRNRGKNEKTVIQLFSDRSIYRPGQTIHVSGIAYRQQADLTQTQESLAVELSLKDANRRSIASQKLTTNSMGSFSTDFQLPKDLLPGNFTILCGQSSISVRVEEYKRPTFLVEARAANNETENRAFSFGDTIQVETIAKTFSGVPVQGAEVHYKVETASVSFWRWYDADWSTISSGDTITGDNGIAAIPVFLDPQALIERIGLVRYRITFDVTDLAGETQSASYSLSVSEQPFGLEVSISSEIDQASGAHTFTIKAINANQQEVDAQGEYILYNVEEGEQGAPILPFTSNTPITLPSDLLPGTYAIRAIARGKADTEIEADAKFCIYNSQATIDLTSQLSTPNSHLSTRFDSDFIKRLDYEFSEAKPARIIFSPCMEDVLLSYMILSNDETILHTQRVIGRKQYQLTIPYEARFGDGITLLMWYVRNGKLFDVHEQITYKRPDKRLSLSWSTFRDKLYPGQEEEWTLTIRNKEGQPVQGAELLALMYDASLDQLADHDLYFSLHFDRNLTYYGTSHSYQNNGSYLRCVKNIATERFPRRYYDELTQYVHDRYSRMSWGRGKLRIGFSGGAMPMFSVNSAARRMDDEEILEDVVVLTEEVSLDSRAALPMQKKSEAVEMLAAVSAEEDTAPALRSNFAETAFFYPHLLSDAEGEVKIGFTLPESLTEWKFMALAHTREVDYGSITSHAVARKDFMIQPNMPRFVREGDKAVISARVINQGEIDLSGQAQLRLIDPDTEQIVFTSFQPFAVEAGQTSSVSFSAEISDRYPMLICEVSGTSGTFSDGERNYLPVLSSKKYVTEVVPFYITPQDTTKSVDVSTLFNQGSPTATHRRMLLEFTEHPEWTVIEALEGIKVAAEDCAPSLAASLYANATASRLASNIPGFEEALRWAREHQVETSSALDDNQELKEIVLKESPWVRDAMAEAEQRSLLLDLFDQQLMDKRYNTALKKLQKLQNSDGSWSWFEGMSGSYYMTLSTCQSLSLLQSDDAEIIKMLEKGLKFLDKEELEQYEYAVKHKQKLYPYGNTMEYLYVSSLLPNRKVSKDIQQMREKYLKAIEQNVRDLTIYGRTRAACLLRTFGHTKAADSFLESAVQYTITKPGMGRYFATDAAYYSWMDYRIPTQLAAMRALRQSDRKDRESLLREMQLWLIRQKQTQHWDNPMNTIGAVEFLLNSQPASDKPQAREEAEPTIGYAFTLDGKNLPAEIDTTKFLAPQLGYIRTQVDESLYGQVPQQLVVSQISSSQHSSPESQTSQRSTLDTQLSWGALYAQYLEEMDHLQQQSSGELKVSTKLIRKADSNEPAPSTLHVGDEVTLRVIVTADRDMDFVQIRMQRPACFEPVNQLSGYRWMNGRGGYVAQHDASTDIFFDTFRKGTMTYDITFRVDRAGEYLSGITTAQCAYSPDFCAHTGAIHIVVK